MPLLPLLLLDTGSPVVSVAVALENGTVTQRAIEQQRSAAGLLELIRAVLDEGGLAIHQLRGIAALRGPGSFTGLRIGLATALGLHQALGVPATALPSLPVLAAAIPVASGGTVVAAVDALRGEWSAQSFAAGRVPHPVSEMELVAGPELPRLAGGKPAVVTGFGVGRLAALPGWPADCRLIEAGPLAAVAARLAAAAGTEWNPELLVSPLYSRPPAPSRAAVPKED